ncbi:hypothetical protein D3C87_1855170 [compost metagenome]
MPGVVQAKLTGTFTRQAMTMLSRPMAMQMDSRPDPACWGDAPAAASAASTRVKVLAEPTTAASAPAKIGWARSARCGLVASAVMAIPGC